MSLNLIGPGGLFTRIGHLIYGINHVVNYYRGTELPNRVGVIQADYSTSDQNLIDSMYSQLASAQASNTTMLTYWRSLAQNTVTQMVNAYQPQLKNDYQSALMFLFNYLIAGGETVVRNTVSATVTPGAGNHGNGVVLVDTYNNLGFPQEQMFNEQVAVRVTRDVQAGAAPGQETLQFSGVYGTTDMLNWLWPQGSNGLVSPIAISPSSSGGTTTTNWLTNGTMEAFTDVANPNVPDGWHVHVGTQGTSILKDLVNFYDGLSSVKFVGNGTEKTALWTQFGVDFSGGAFAADQLAVNLFYKLSAVPAAGVLTVSLVDGTGLTLNDRAGNPASISVNLTTGDMSWHALSGFLRMPTTFQVSGVYLMISLSTALSAGVTLNIDRVSMARPVIFYPGGPQLACFSGNVNWIVGDTHTIATNNAFNGLMQSGCNQLLNLSNYGLIFPSTTGTASILDSLVQ